MMKNNVKMTHVNCFNSLLTKLSQSCLCCQSRKHSDTVLSVLFSAKMCEHSNGQLPTNREQNCVANFISVASST